MTISKYYFVMNSKETHIVLIDFRLDIDEPVHAAPLLSLLIHFVINISISIVIKLHSWLTLRAGPCASSC